MRVWVTRSQPGADQTAARLRALGHEPLVAPVLEVQALDAAPLDLEGVTALAFTSANAVRAFATALERCDRAGEARRLPVFAVGDATAQAALAHGLAAPLSADGDVAALAEAIARDGARPDGVVLHPCALEAAGDLAGDLAGRGIAVREAPLYRTVGVRALAPAVACALDAPGDTAILVHSPRAARAVRDLLRTVAAPAAGPARARPASARPEPALARPLGRRRLVALSPACAAPLIDLPFADVLIASAPREDALLQALGR